MKKPLLGVLTMKPIKPKIFGGFIGPGFLNQVPTLRW